MAFNRLFFMVILKIVLLVKIMLKEFKIPILRYKNKLVNSKYFIHLSYICIKFFRQTDEDTNFSHYIIGISHSDVRRQGVLRERRQVPRRTRAQPSRAAEEKQT